MGLLEKLKKVFSLSGIIIFILGTLVGSVIGFYVNSYMTEIHKVSDVDFTLGALDKDEIGYYLPIKITNSGDNDLEDIRVRYQNEYMEHYREFYIPKLISHQMETLKLRDEDTISMYTKKACGPDENITAEGCEIQVVRINETKHYIPPQNCSIYLCDFINYSATVYATVDAKDFEKSFEGRFYAPRDIPLIVTPDEPLDISNQTISNAFSMELFDNSPQELLIYEGFLYPHNLEYGPFLPLLPLKFQIFLINESQPLDITVDYLYFPKFSRYS